MQYRHLEAIVDRGAKAETVTSYTFDRVVPPEVGQRELFEMSGVQELMDAALTGINVSVLAYGQTGSGKTYTMSGLEEHVLAGFRKDDQTSGLISRSVSHLFQRISEDLEGSTTTVKACFSEIYNEVRGVFFFRAALVCVKKFLKPLTPPPPFYYPLPLSPLRECTTFSTSQGSSFH